MNIEISLILYGLIMFFISLCINISLIFVAIKFILYAFSYDMSFEKQIFLIMGIVILHSNAKIKYNGK